MKKLTMTWGIVVNVTLLGLGLLAGLKWQTWRPAREMERIARSMIGHPEADLVKVLGEPMHVVSIVGLDGRSIDYPWKGMNFAPVPNHPVRNKVLLYSTLNMAIYVYVDKRSVIEYVATAWT